MATVKEVKILKDGAMVTPVVLTDSVKNLDGTKYKDIIYTKTEIDSKFNHKFQTYTVSGDLGTNSSNDNIVLSLDVGDSAVVLSGYVNVYDRGFRIKGQVTNGKYFVASLEDDSIGIIEDSSGYIKELQGHSSGFTHKLVVYIVRLA